MNILRNIQKHYEFLGKIVDRVGRIFSRSRRIERLESRIRDLQKALVMVTDIDLAAKLERGDFKVSIDSPYVLPIWSMFKRILCGELTGGIPVPNCVTLRIRYDDEEMDVEIKRAKGKSMAELRSEDEQLIAEAMWIVDALESGESDKDKDWKLMAQNWIKRAHNRIRPKGKH